MKRAYWVFPSHLESITLPRKRWVVPSGAIGLRIIEAAARFEDCVDFTMPLLPEAVGTELSPPPGFEWTQ